MANKKTKQEKLLILHKAQQTSILEASRKHGVSSATLYNWRNAYQGGGEAALSDQGKLDQGKLHKELQLENKRLKKLLIDRELDLEVQRELLKKKFGTDDPRKI